MTPTTYHRTYRIERSIIGWCAWSPAYNQSDGTKGTSLWAATREELTKAIDAELG